MKESYIVYLTVNKINGKIYVGVHKTNIPNKFDGYLGNNVWVRKSGKKFPNPQTPFQRSVSKHGYDSFTRHTLFVFSTAEEAFKREAEIVTTDFIKSHKNYNAATGGLGGGIAYILKPIHQYNTQGVHIKSYNLSTEVLELIETADNKDLVWANIVSCTKGFAKEAYGFRWSFKLKKHLPKQPEIKLQKVHQYSLTGEYLNTFDSASIAARELVGDSEAANTIRKCARGIYSKAYGFLWSFSKTEDIKERVVLIIEQRKRTHKYTKTGGFVESFDSLGEAVKSLKDGAHKTPISKCMDGRRKSAYGFVWKSEKI